MSDGRAVLRIGEVSRRTGVGVPTLRAWERRYALLTPERTEGGHRLYSERDVERVRTMQQLLADGWSAGAAAQEVVREPATVTPLRAVPADARTSGGDDSAAAQLIERIEAAIAAFDAPATDAAIDDLFARLNVPSAMDQVMLPVLRRVGDGWQEDPRVIAREHFASNTLRQRLQRLLRGHVRPGARSCLAVAPEGEDHDLGLLAGAVVAADAGWRVHYLGARTPVDTWAQTVELLDPDVVLVGALHRHHAEDLLDHFPTLRRAAVVFGGAGFEPADVGRVGGVVHLGPISGLPATMERAIEARGSVG